MTPLDRMLRDHEIERFLRMEAALIDERRFDEWIELFADDLHYWMPVRGVRLIKDRGRALSGPGEVAHFDETRDLLKERTDRLVTNMAWSDDPVSQTRHLITNVMVDDAEEADEVVVQSNFLVHQQRMERDVDVFVGSRTDVLRADPDGAHGWLIARRLIALDQTVVLAKAITTFF